jgi:GT2 family glycosyltransferase
MKTAAPGYRWAMPRTTVVIMTRNRVEELRRTLDRLAELQPRPPVIVVDNASTDGTTDQVRADYPWVKAIRRGVNEGALARNLGVRQSTTPYVAFCDDDSWWHPKALQIAEEIFDRHPRVAVITGRTLVGPEERVDPISDELARSPLGQVDDLPGPSVLGFLACSAIVRRDAFLEVGGFNAVVQFPGEERLLSWDLAARGWAMCYVDDIVAYHHPSAIRPPSAWRRAVEVRNDLLTDLMRRPWSELVPALKRLRHQPRAIPGFVRRLPRALVQRRRLPRRVEDQIKLLERS